MRCTIMAGKEVYLKTLHISVGVRYWEDGKVNGIEDIEGNLIPLKNSDSWEPVIEIDNGKIIDWTIGTIASIHYKVCDDGTYLIKDQEGDTIFEYCGYVPICMSPKENGYGDYIIMDIDENGIIKDWKFNINDFPTED